MHAYISDATHFLKSHHSQSQSPLTVSQRQTMLDPRRGPARYAAACQDVAAGLIGNRRLSLDPGQARPGQFSFGKHERTTLLKRSVT